MTYNELDIRSRAVAFILQGMQCGGKRLILIYPSGPEFIVAFLGSIFAGSIAVPVYPPFNSNNFLRFKKILVDSQSNIILT